MNDPQPASAKPTDAALLPNIEREEAAWSRGMLVAGVDEAGRGALAGPVVAGAVVFSPYFGRSRKTINESGESDSIPESLRGVRDSKLAGPKERPILAARVARASLACATGSATAAEIDMLGIARAGDLAMIRALRALSVSVDRVLVDGFRIRMLRGMELSGVEMRGIEQQAIVKGDRKVLSIAAASLLAKAHRDAELVSRGLWRPEYGLEQHKGYGAPAHLRALALHGPTQEHRLSWAPLRAIAPSRTQENAEQSSGQHGRHFGRHGQLALPFSFGEPKLAGVDMSVRASL